MKHLPFRLGPLGVVIFLGAVSVHAPAARAVTETERAAARKMMAEGDEAASHGDLQAAESHYRGAHEVMHVPTTGLALARVLAQQGKLLEANSMALEVANSKPTQDESALMVQARQEAGALSAELLPQIPMLTLEVVPGAANFTLEVDGRALSSAVSRKPLPLNPGRHVIKLQAPGFISQIHEVLLIKGRRDVLQVGLIPGQADAVQARPLPSTVAGGSEGADFNAWGWVATVGGGAVLAGGLVAGLVSANNASDIKDICEGTSCFAEQKAAIQDSLDSGRSLAWVANICIPLGLVGMGIGIYSLLTDSAQEPPVALRSVAGQPGVGLRF